MKIYYCYFHKLNIYFKIKFLLFYFIYKKYNIVFLLKNKYEILLFFLNFESLHGYLINYYKKLFFFFFTILNKNIFMKAQNFNENNK